MDGDFASKLKTVLSDPEAMAKISAIASNLGNVPADQPQSTEPPKRETPSFSPDLLSSVGQNLFPMQNDPRVALLSSLKPLLREEKRGKVDALVKALAVASMMKNFRK